MDHPEWQKNIREAQARVRTIREGKEAAAKQKQEEQEAAYSEHVADFLGLLGLPRGVRCGADRKIDNYTFGAEYNLGSYQLYLIRDGEYSYEARHRNRWGNFYSQNGVFQLAEGEDLDEWKAWIATTIDELESAAKIYADIKLNVESTKEPTKPLFTREQQFYNLLHDMILTVVRENCTEGDDGY